MTLRYAPVARGKPEPVALLEYGEISNNRRCLDTGKSQTRMVSSIRVNPTYRKCSALL